MIDPPTMQVNATHQAGWMAQTLANMVAQYGNV